MLEIARAARSKGPQSTERLKQPYSQLLNSRSRVLEQSKRSRKKSAKRQTIRQYPKAGIPDEAWPPGGCSFRQGWPTERPSVDTQTLQPAGSCPYDGADHRFVL